MKIRYILLMISIPIVLVVMYLSFSAIKQIQYPQRVSISADDVKDDPEPLSGSIKCLEKQRNVGACIELYKPVCATVNIQCITSPCEPIKETFSNFCKACDNALVSEYVEGECDE